MRSGRPMSRLSWLWIIVKTWWLVASGAERTGVATCVGVAAVFVGLVFFTGTARDACFARIAEAERALAQSNAAIDRMTRADVAERCAAYRERVTLLGRVRLAGCAQPPTGGRERFNDPDVERSFYERLITETCSRLPDPSCSGPACATDPGG